MEENVKRCSKISIPEKREDDQFPIGLKVLAIDANIVCLRYLVQLLQKCQYKVTSTTEAAEALMLLKEEKEAFDIIITNVVRHDMDGFKILEIIGLGMDIPVVMVSANEDLEMVKRGVMEGAEAYLLKPVSLHELRNIWQHVLRKRSRKRSNPNVMEQLIQEEQKRIVSHESLTINKEDYETGNPSSNSKKKSRVSWTKELHEKFIAAYEQLREKERVPNNILKLMNDPNLSRENIASHLQKHRDMLRKNKGSGVGKLGKSHKNYNWTIQRRNEVSVSNSRPQLTTSDQFQFSNLARSSMEQFQPTEIPRSTWTPPANYFPVPDFKWFNSLPSNDFISKPCDQCLGFGPNNTTTSYYPQYPLESKCLNLASLSFGNCPIDAVAAIPDPAPALACPFPNNNATAGIMCQFNDYIKF